MDIASSNFKGKHEFTQQSEKDQCFVGIILLSGMKTYIVQLEVHDDVISTRDKISWGKARRVLLVWPRKGRILERRVDLLLLQRHGQQIGTQIAIVTRSGDVRANARELGIPVFKSPLQAQKNAWRSPKVQPPSRPTGQKPLDPQELRAWRETFRERTVLNRWQRLAIFLVGVAAFLVMALFFMPGARVELEPISHTQELTIDAWASPKITSANLSGGIPAYPLQVVVEGRGETESTGTTALPDGMAVGQVQLTNLTDQVVIVPKGSVVLTLDSSPVRFLITREVELPAEPGASVMVSVRAAVPGTSGNVAAGEIRAMEGPIGMRLTVDNPNPTRGGTERRSPAPSANDYRSLRKKLLEQLEQTALEELNASLADGQRLLLNTVRVHKVVAENRNPPEDQPADRLQLTLQVEFEAWYVEERDLQAIAQTALDASLPKDFEPQAGPITLAFVQEPDLDNAGNARWSLKVERVLKAGWSDEKVVQVIRGQSIENASRILQDLLALNSEPKITLFPSWWGRLPFIPFRIEVVQL